MKRRSWRYPLAVVVISAVGAGAMGIASTKKDAALPSAELVFERGADLYVASSDGSDARLLVRDAASPAVSNDATEIAFVRRGRIWIVHRDGTRARRLTRAAATLSPAWSPDGRYVYFSRYRRGRGHRAWSVGILRVRADGTGEQQVVRATPTYRGYCALDVAPSPDGRALAFSEYYDECEFGLYVRVAVRNRAGELITPNLGPSRDPAWSPDGRRLAFTSVDEWGDSTGIVVARSDGRDRRRVARGAVGDPAWSPDGKWIAFDAGRDIRLVRADGTDARRVEPAGEPRSDAAWLPPVS